MSARTCVKLVSREALKGAGFDSLIVCGFYLNANVLSGSVLLRALAALALLETDLKGVAERVANVVR